MRRWTFLAALTLGGCDDTVNNDDAFVPYTVRASLSSAGGEANETSGIMALSGDGRHLLFYSLASNLDPDGLGFNFDLFMKDLETGAVRLVNRATGAAGAKTPGFLGASRPSFDGRYVAFVTAEPLDPDDADATEDVYLRDLREEATTLVSRATGGAKANGFNRDPDLSADGRYLVFTSNATNLSAEAMNGEMQVFIRDLVSGTTELVSRATGPAGAVSNGFHRLPRVSADGSRVAFLGVASNLGGSGVSWQVYARDRDANQTIYVSRATGAAGAGANAEAQELALSHDGRLVAWVTAATGLDPNDADAHSDVFARDLGAETTVHVSRGDGPAGVDADERSSFVDVSADGRYVSFSTAAGALVEGDGNGVRDVFVRDLLRGRTRRVSVRTFGAEGTQDSLNSSLSADGRIIAFESAAPDLVDNDGNSRQDVFVRRPLW